VATLEGGAPTLKGLRSLKYLQACLDESLRLHPPVPRNYRIAVRDTVLPVGGGPEGRNPVLVQAGTEVGYSVYAMHRRKDVFGDDAGDIRPERWEHLRPGWAFLPFNGGPRTCVGQEFTRLTVGYCTVRLTQEIKELRCWDQKL
jgi:cytochrome P450